MEQTDTITISKFKATCLAVLGKVKRTGRSVLVTKHGKPIAVIDPPPPPPPPKNVSWLGTFKSTGRICGDIVAPASRASEWRALNE